MTLPDNRIRLSSTKIDFSTEFGITGLDIENYPPEGGQARFDHLRSVILGLLSQQSSYDEPSQQRDGTPWFDFNTSTLKIWYNNEWKLYSEVIPLEIDGSEVVTLQDWYRSVAATLITLGPELCFSGTCTVDGISDIPIPLALQNQIYTDSRAFVHVNGQLIGPREVQFIGSPIPTSIKLITYELESNDTFVVLIRRIASTGFVSTNVIIP